MVIATWDVREDFRGFQAKSSIGSKEPKSFHIFLNEKDTEV